MSGAENSRKSSTEEMEKRNRPKKEKENVYEGEEEVTQL
jgi:hypothetical protein